MSTRRTTAVLATLLSLLACAQSNPIGQGVRDRDGGAPDGPTPPIGTRRDAARPDAPPDASMLTEGTRDAALRDGAGVDAGAREDGASPTDASIDAGYRADAGRSAEAGASDAGALACGTWTGRTPIRALFVGNSQIDFWDLPKLVSDLSQSAPAGCPRIVGERFTRGGANLHDLWEGTDTRGRRLVDVLAARDHDVVVLAESIDLAEFRPLYPDAFVDVATLMIDAVEASDAVPILYATAYVERPDTTGFHAMADDQLALGRALGVTVAAGGLGWLRVWAEAPTIDLYYTDRQHPGYRGSYVSALVIYAAITGASPIGLTNDPPTTACEGGPCPAIGVAEAAIFQRAAWAEYLATGL